MLSKLRAIRKASEAAELFLAQIPRIVEALKLLREFEARRGRDAETGDLEDNIARLEGLTRE